MTNRIECTPLDIALVDDKVVAAGTTDSHNGYSLCFQRNSTENHKAESVDHVYTDGKNVHMIVKRPMLFTIDVESSQADTQKILDGIARITGSDFSRKENKNAQAVITNIKDLPDHKSKFSTSMDRRRSSVISAWTYWTTKSLLLDASLGYVPNFAQQTGPIKNAIRMQKKRLAEEAEHKEQENIKVRWETNAKKTNGTNVFDSHLSEENFVIGDILGAGTYGTVFEATSKKSGKAFALKVMTNKFNVYTEKFVAERELLMQREMSHKNIVPMYAAFKSKIAVFFVFERMKESVMMKKIPVDEMAWITECVASGLTYIHRRGILHRDLKPHNLLYNYDGLVKISDFGISTDERDATNCGTPRYMAPEIICRQKQTAAVDCYSLGVILHRCSTRKTPFELPDGHVSDEVVSKCEYVPPVSMNSSVREVTTKLIKRSPNDRWSANEVLFSQLVTGYQHQREQALQKLVRDNYL
ncbi:hypothetical protein CRE_31305 [Caenorhabditis remanei]|uniref:Protein kinase domain-containing protein n=1 Tax=Caenorhabditis remanei TaxID=31234 RepID=E3MLS1_CAERE|nr:hypothetical protein CRE_31305 [Caenorhabditis remanei]